MALIVALICIPISVFVNGWTLSVLWAWFAVPIFLLPPLTIFQAAGVSVVVGFLVYVPTSPVESDKDKILKMAEYVAVRPALYLAVGYFVRFWLM